MKKILIIGAGPGGYFLATEISSKYKQCEVTIVEKGELGGTCLNIGCIPTKALLDHISLLEHIKESKNKRKIFSFEEININIEGLRNHQEEIIKQLKQGIEKSLAKNQIKLIQGEATFISGNRVKVKTKKEEMEIEADEIIIATGSSPRSVPSFEVDKRLVVTSDDVWNIPQIPKDILIVGTGPIGIEFARVFHALGSNVTMTEIQETICPILDKEISENLARSLKKRGIKTIPNVASKQIEKKENKVAVEFLSTTGSEKEKREFDQVLVAVGRKPNIENLGLEKAKVELDKEGFIKTNGFLQTTNKNIWAVGDVTHFPQLAHTASFQARVVAENISSNKPLKEFDSRFIPSCIYGYPEIAFVGKTEEELKEEKISYIVGKSLFLASGKAKASGLTEGLVKVLVDKNTKKILGAHIIGPEASNLIHELVIAMQNDLTADQITSTIHAHPTYSETVHEALLFERA